jgi:hypothetical protein
MKMIILILPVQLRNRNRLKLDPRSGETTHAPAAVAKNTSNVMVRRPEADSSEPFFERHERARYRE